MEKTLIFAALAIACLPSAFAAFQNGDSCGVTSRKFLNYDFRSDFMVAGESGCTLGDDTGCFCAPNLNDGEALSEWQWQCNGVVNFGPQTTKTCPDLVPVAKGLGQLDIVRNRALSEGNTVASIGAESMQQKMSVPCDTSIHPTGRPGDEVCPYSDCDEGGNHSAICACVDLEKYGMGEGMEWVCMHATCGCGDDEENGEAGFETENEEEFIELPTSASQTPTKFGVSSVLAVALMSLLMN